MRFQVSAAFAIGLLLPVLETIRRGFAYFAIDTMTVLEDYLAGVLLLCAGFAATRGVAYADRLLLAAWSGVTAMMTLSFLGQIEVTIRGVDLEPHNGDVLAFKLLLWLTCAGALSRSFRGVGAASGSEEPPRG